MDEQEWVDLARQGDIEAFNQLVLRYQDRVYAQAFWMVSEAQAAEDLAQEAFLTAFYKMNTFRGGSFDIWLLRIVINLSLDELRRSKRHQIISLEPPDADGEEIESPHWLADPSGTPEEALERTELEEAVRRCINRLPDEFRFAVVLVDLQGLNYAEAAAVLRVSIGTVKSRLARGRRRLRDAWSDLNPSMMETLPPKPTTLGMRAFSH